MLRHYAAGNGVFTDRLDGLAAGLTAHGLSGPAAQTGALQLLEQGLMRQAMTMAYNDAFLIMLLINLITLPAVLLLRRPKAAAHVEAVME